MSKCQGFVLDKNCGKSIVLGPSRQEATKPASPEKGQDIDGIILSQEPMEPNKLYEVRIGAKREESGHPFPVGVVTAKPKGLKIPDRAGYWKEAVTIFTARITDKGIKKLSAVGKKLGKLGAERRVGLSVDINGTLRLFIDGALQGVVPCDKLPKGSCYFMAHLVGPYTQVNTLPLTDVTNVSAPALHQGFGFNQQRHGQNVVFSYIDYRPNAERVVGKDGGIVLSEEALEYNKLYQVRVQGKGGSGGVALPLGVVIPDDVDDLIVPAMSHGWNQAIVIEGNTAQHFGAPPVACPFGECLTNLPVHSTVGICLTKDGFINLFLNGVWKGKLPLRPGIVIWSAPTYLMVDLYDCYTEVSSLPVTDADLRGTESCGS